MKYANMTKLSEILESLALRVMKALGPWLWSPSEERYIPSVFLTFVGFSIHRNFQIPIVPIKG